MAYNIDSWKCRKVENLIIPIEALYPEVRKDWKPNNPTVDFKSMEVLIEGGSEGFELKGALVDGEPDKIKVSSIKLYGEGSGSFLSYVLEPALRQSKGELDVVLIWEGGDSITNLLVKDGVYSNKPMTI